MELAGLIHLKKQVVFISTQKNDFYKKTKDISKYVLYNLPILTLFVLSSDILTNIFVIKRLQHLFNLFGFILRN